MANAWGRGYLCTFYLLGPWLVDTSPSCKPFHVKLLTLTCIKVAEAAIDTTTLLCGLDDLLSEDRNVRSASNTTALHPFRKLRSISIHLLSLDQ